MNGLETDIRHALDARAGVAPVRSMPPGTLGRIRRRQALVASAIAIVLVAIGTGGSMLTRASTVDRLGPGGMRAPRSVLEEVPAGWPVVDVHDPSTAYEPAPVEYHAVDAIRVVAAGTVEGHGFSFLAWTGSTEDDGTEGPCFLFAGPSPTGSEEGTGGPVVATCADGQAAHVPEAADLFVLGQQDAAVAGIGANMGFLSPRVSELVVVLDDGTRSRIPIVRGSDGWGAVRTFLFFPPPEAGGGTLLALDGEGTPLARARICVFGGGFSGACGGPAEQLVAINQGR